MNVFKEIDELGIFENSIITIGSFDGVHMGHQKIIQRIIELARQKEGNSVLVTFHPHPRKLINKQAVKLLSPLDEKIELVRKAGIDSLVVVPFTRAFSEQAPEAYINDFLYEKLKPNTIVIGYDHQYGKNRVGDINLLKQHAKQLNFSVEEISKQTIDNLSISSTKIRNALNSGEINTANELLGRSYLISGIVVRGEQLGRKIGFPTANIQINDEDKLIPQHGVYAVKVKVRDRDLLGMLNIGVRPTVNGSRETIEVNIFKFDENIYGETITVFLESFIREEHKFLGLSELMEQIQKDKETVLAFFDAQN